MVQPQEVTIAPLRESPVSDDPESILWDDDAFRARVRAAAAMRGRTLAAVLTGAGLSEHYLRKRVEGRSTNIVMKIARELAMTPTELAGWPMTQAEPACFDDLGLDMAGRLGDLLSQAPAQHVQMFAMQVAAILAAKTGRDEEVIALARLIVERTVGTMPCKAEGRSEHPVVDRTESNGVEYGASDGQQRGRKRRKSG